MAGAKDRPGHGPPIPRWERDLEAGILIALALEEFLGGEVDALGTG